MKRLFLAAAAAAALLTGASTASAGLQYHTLTPPEPDGSISGTFGHTGIEQGAFSNIFDFALPTGWSSFTATSSFFTNATNDIDFTSITFNGTNFNVLSTGQVESRFLIGAATTAGPQQLIVNGTSGGNGSFAGTLAFTPMAAVPEPAAWALMISGFGAAGAMLRRRQKVAIAAA